MSIRKNDRLLEAEIKQLGSDFETCRVMGVSIHTLPRLKSRYTQLREWVKMAGMSKADFNILMDEGAEQVRKKQTGG